MSKQLPPAPIASTVGPVLERQRLFYDIASDTERHFSFRAIGRGFMMYEDTKWHNVISDLKHFFVLMYRYYILISYVECNDETR